ADDGQPAIECHNHAAAAHTVNDSVNLTSKLRSSKTFTGSPSDSTLMNFTVASIDHTVQVIIPSKTVCRQRINTFFIVAIPDTLLDQSIAQPGKSVTTKLTGATNIQVNNINIGGGADELELLLKTPGRVTNNTGLNGFVSIATVTAYLSRWATSFLYH
ncbi:MAG: hypothetical protein J7621_03855, partial [Niastella sp.]|nr:hypothetical protein [Niastella sp.]